MNSRSIPGFYFDPEKKKFFRIQANHRAPAGSAYSKDAIKSQEQAARQQAAARHRQQREKGSIQRKRDIDLELSLRLRTGQHRPVDLLALNYAHKLACRSVRVDGVLQSSLVSHGTLYTISLVGRSRPRLLIRSSSLPSPMSVYEVDVPPATYNRAGLSPVNDARPAWYFRDRLAFFSTNGPSAAGLVSQYDDFSSTLWDISTRSVPSLLTVAVAAESGLHVIQEGGGTQSERKLLGKEQMVTTFQQYQPVIMSGDRSGKVTFTDLRAREAPSVLRLQHSHRACGINGIITTKHPEQVVVSAINGTVSLYDLRFVAAVSAKRRAPSKPFVDFAVPQGSTSSYDRPGKQLAYLESLNIIAAVSSLHCYNAQHRMTTPKGQVTLYQGSTGRILPTPQIAAQTAEFPINSLCVGRLRDGIESIFLNSSDRIFELNMDFDHGEDDSVAHHPSESRIIPPSWMSSSANLWE